MTRLHSSRSFLAAALLVAVVAPWAAADDAPWRFDPGRRVHVGGGVAADAFASLEQRIEGLERGGSSRFRVVVVVDTPLRLERLAHDLATRWAARQEFELERTFVVVCALRQGAVALLPPAAVRDRLGLGPDEVRATWTAEAAARLTAVTDREGQGAERVAGLLGDFVDRVADEVDDRLRRSDEERLRALEASDDARAALEASAPQLSAELVDAELSLIDHAARSLDLTEAAQALTEARERFALGLGRTRFDPSAADGEFRRVRRLIAQARVRLDHMRAARARLGAALEEAQQAAAAQDGALGAETADDGVARRLELARRALGEARRQDAGGRPDRALERVAEARRHLAEAVARRRSAERAADEEPGVGAWGWVLLGVGFPSLGLFLWGTGLLLARSRALLVLDSLRGAAERQAERLGAELHGLGALLRAASTPQAIEAPTELAEGPLPPPSEYVGVTARQLRYARSLVDALVRDWSGLEVGLVRSEILRSHDDWRTTRPLHAAAAALEDVPRRNVPLAEIRRCAAEIERLQRAPARCALAMRAAAQALSRAETALEGVLQSGQATSALDDDFADLLEQAREAAILAVADPLASIEAAQSAAQIGEDLERRAQRIVDAALDRAQLEAQLRDLSGSAAASLDAGALPLLSAFLQDRVDRACAQLDVGLDGPAREELLQTQRLCRGVRALETRTSGVLEELETLRAELREGHHAYRELTEEFGVAATRDLESGLLRAAAWIELVEEAVQAGRRVSRVQTRLQLIRQGLVAVTGRLLVLRGERERVTSLIEEIRARADAVQSFVDREEANLAPAERGRLQAVVAAIEDAAASAAVAEVPWADLRQRVELVERELDEVRALLGEAVLRGRRAARLSRGLTAAIRTAGDIMAHDSLAHPGAELRLAAAREGLAAGDALRTGSPADRERALAELGMAARALHQSRALTDARRATGILTDPGVLGDAEFTILMAAAARANAARRHILGETEEPPVESERLTEALGSLRDDPTRALDAADEVLRAAGRAATEAASRRAERAVVAFDERRRRGDWALDSRLRTAYLIRLGERHRRARFEILGLGEEPDLAAVDGDLDREDDDEVAALEDATDAASLEAGPAPSPETSTGDALSAGASDVDAEDASAGGGASAAGDEVEIAAPGDGDRDSSSAGDDADEQPAADADLAAGGRVAGDGG